MRIHTTKKPYKCDLCDYRAKVSKDVQTHKRKHHNKDTIKLKCSECDYESLWHGNITRHFKRAHENIKAYECEACDRAFTVKIALQRHQYTVHDIKNLPLFKCSKCEFETIHSKS